MVSIPIGVFSAVNKGSRKERSLSTALFMLYSMPTFWIGTMLVTFLCNPDYFDWFPPAYSLLEIPEDAGFFDRFVETAYYLILPLVLLDLRVVDLFISPDAWWYANYSGTGLHQNCTC